MSSRQFKMKFAIDMLRCIVTPDCLFRPFKQKQSSREEKRIYMKSRKLYIIITVGCLALWSLLVSLLMLGIHEKRNEIAGLSESKLEMPNVFTPNGDGINDIYRAKEGYQSIVSFEAAVFNRWGKRLHRWTDPADGWDGTLGGQPVPAGAYYCVVKAVGADGVKYNFKKTINLLRGYSEESGSLDN